MGDEATEYFKIEVYSATHGKMSRMEWHIVDSGMKKLHSYSETLCDLSRILCNKTILYNLGVVTEGKTIHLDYVPIYGMELKW
jgi:hypothetical protein